MSQPFSAILHQRSRIVAWKQYIQTIGEHRPPATAQELLRVIENATTPAMLTKAVNRLQERLWQYDGQEQAMLRADMVSKLQNQVLCASSQALRKEAASWLRFFQQAGLVAQPQDIFVTLIASTMQSEEQEQLFYLSLLFDCIWPFRNPYPAYSWSDFPAESVFVPLTSLLDHAALEEMLMAIFAELPTLEHPILGEHLHPIAQRWAKHQELAHRMRACRILARIR